ncbi:MAG: translocation/assembly module TamB domain-containing protein [Thermodesulfobacteriota bacterium]|nr:translocation/assembly module TamB domain-containing protein [Thermodesulfobacteriota bacterium]
MKFIKWSLIGVVAVIAVFLFLLIGVRFYLNTDRARQQLQAKVNQAIPGTLTWSKSRLWVWRGEVELHNVLLSAPTNDKLLELNRLFLRVSWNRLLKGELCVNNLFFETPRIYLKTDRLGNLNLVQALSPPENTESKPMDSGLPFNVVIRELNVLNGFFQYQTAEAIAENQKDRMVFQNVNLTIRDANLLKQKARLVCEIHGGNIAGRRIDRINLSCHLKDRCLTINDLNLYTFAGRFDLKGQVDFKKAFANGFISSHPDLNAISYKLSLRQKDTLLETMPFKESGLKGSITSLIEIKGTGINPKTLTAETALELFASKLSTGETFSPFDAHVKAQANMEKGRVTVHQLDARAGKTHLEVAGDYDISSLKVAADFKFNAPDLTQVLSLLGINALGKMNIHGNVGGTVAAPIVDAQLQGENLEFEQVKIGDANAKIQFSEGVLSLDHGKIRNHNSLLDISGTVRIRDSITRDILENPGLDISLKGDALFIEDFVEGIKGKLVLNGHIFGHTAHPQGNLNIKGEHIDVYNWKVQEFQLTSDLDGNRFNLDTFELVIAPGEKILLHGWISLNKDYHLRLVSEGISLKNVPPFQLGDGDTGKISFMFQGQGDFENPQIKGEVVLNELRFYNQPLQDERFQIEVKDRTAYISGGRNFALDATYHLQTNDFSASAGFDNTNLSPYLTIAGPSKLNGSITGKIQVTGNAQTPDQIKGWADISRIDILFKQTPLVRSRDVKAFLTHGEISIPGIRLDLFERGILNINGSAKLNGDLDIKADGNIPLEVISHFSDVFPNAAGDVLLSLRMNGNLSQPFLRADAEIKNAGMTVPGLSQSMHDLNGRIRVTPEAVVLDNIRGMLDTGSFELFGAIDLNAYRPSRVRLKLKAHDLPIMIPDTLETRLSAELDIRGTPEKSLISGDVQILEGKYYKDVHLNLIESLGKKSREEALITSEIPWPFLKNVEFDITIRYREPFVVDNNIALLALKPDFRIYGSVNQPLISGRAEVESGTVYFQKKEFNVKKGVFDFINPYKIEPTIDVQSEVMVREWTIFLNVFGTPENLKFNFSSDPSEREEDIISLLVTGKTTQELIAREGGLSRSSEQILANILAETAQKQIKDVTGLDVVELEYTEATEAEESDEVTVIVGKELSRRVTVKYGMQTKNAKVIQQVITEYKFLEKLLMNTFQDTEGNFGGGLQFRLEFR